MANFISSYAKAQLAKANSVHSATKVQQTQLELQRLKLSLKEAIALADSLRGEYDEAKDNLRRARKIQRESLYEIQRIEGKINGFGHSKKRNYNRDNRKYDLECELATLSITYAEKVKNLRKAEEAFINVGKMHSKISAEIRSLRNKIEKTTTQLQEERKEANEKFAYQIVCWDEVKAAACDLLELSDADRRDATIACRDSGSTRVIYGNNGITHGHAEINNFTGKVTYHRPPEAEHGSHNYIK